MLGRWLSPDTSLADVDFADASLADDDAGLVDTGLVDVDFADAGLAEAGLVEADFADAGRADVGLVVVGFVVADRATTGTGCIVATCDTEVDDGAIRNTGTAPYFCLHFSCNAGRRPSNVFSTEQTLGTSCGACLL